MPPSELIEKQPPCIWSGFNLPSRAGQRVRHLLRDLHDALLVGVLDDGHHQAVRCIGCKPML